MGRKPRLTIKKVADALTETRGGVAMVASMLGVSLTTIYNYLEKYPDLKELKNSFTVLLVDKGVYQLHDAVEAGDPWAVKYALSTQGKDRGYTERQEITGADGSELEIKLTWGDE